ncbi:MAG: hypothetical protein KDE27_28110 [Planctomycetes bacterium]|nr:hypothetical protein [Planctomycetota bacterium]
MPFDIRRQPDDTTCGPTCLHAVYRYWGHEVGLGAVAARVPTLPDGGTLGVLLATDALAHGYRATLITWNLNVFDPTWFRPDAAPLRDNLVRRAEAKSHDAKLHAAATAYVEFVDRGGAIRFRDLTPRLLAASLRRRVPILTGLSATFLYQEARQRPSDDVPDDIAGEPVGHFVVLTGYEPKRRAVYVTDPMHPNALSPNHTYPVSIDRVVGAIYLGVLTYDANLILIEPQRQRGAKD